MDSTVIHRRRFRRVLYVGVLTAASIGATPAAAASQLDPMVEVRSPAGLAPDAQVSLGRTHRLLPGEPNG